MNIKGLLMIGILGFSSTLVAQVGEGSLDPSQPQGTTPEEITKKFADKEKLFKTAREQYTYRQDVKIQTLEGETVDGEYRQVFDVIFDAQDKKIKNFIFAPAPSLTRISVTREDIDDIENRLPFVLTSDEIGDYNILYAGQQKEDELQCYVFDIAPKTVKKGQRYFQGRIWVDDHDFQIVKTYGKTVPDIRQKKGQENLFPSFTTWREQIDGQYWFPTYTRADDMLKFSSGEVHIREIVKYTNYKRFGAKHRIIFGDKEIVK